MSNNKDEGKNNKDEDSLMDALHGDKKEVLKKQAEKIEDEIKEREDIDSEMVESIEKEKEKIDKDITIRKQPDYGVGSLAPSSLSSEDRGDVMTLEKEKLGLSREERGEMRDCWKDVQHLKKEEREVEKDLLELEKRKKRHDD